MKYAVSACLLGVCCKYNGGHNVHHELCKFLKDQTYISICPEMMGGLSSPRPSCEIVGDKVMSVEGEDYSEAFHLGAQKALHKITKEQVVQVIVQPRSPSCGESIIYDGSFQGCLVPGDGIFVRYLKDAGVQVSNVDDFLSASKN